MRKSHCGPCGKEDGVESIMKDKIAKALADYGTIGEAAKALEIDRRTLRGRAIKYGLHIVKKQKQNKKNSFKLEDILSGKHPQYSSGHLSKRLVEAGIKEYKCESCLIKEYNGKNITLELNHKDGNHYNHVLENLELLCPNCHSQTETYRFKNREHKNK